MAKTFTAPFAQTPKTLTAVVTSALANLGTDAPTGMVIVATAGADGAIVTSLTVIPRASATASSLLLFLSKDGTTFRLIDSISLPTYVTSTTVAVPLSFFGNISDTRPMRLEAGDKLYVGSQVAQTAGLIFLATWTDF